jgi:putative PIN family toxin of toxin-antitoxin system
MAPPPRLVLDTNVCLDLFVFGDPRVHAIDAALRAGHVVAVTREDCRDEWLRVLRYPQLRLDEAACAQHAAAFDARIICLDADMLVARPDVRLPRCADADDQKFLELAWQANAAALVTRDDALLVLARRTRRDGLFEIVTPQRLAQAWLDGDTTNGGRAPR